MVILNSLPHFAPRLRLQLAILWLRALPLGRDGARAASDRLPPALAAHASAGDRRFMELTARASRAGYINRLKLLTQYDVREHLHEIRYPTLFLAASRDHLVPSVAQAQYMAARVPGSVVRVLDGHGHICLIAASTSKTCWRSGVPQPDLHHASLTPLFTV